VADSLRVFIDAARARVDDALEQYLPKPPRCPPLISEAMRYSLFAGGKRFRPVLTLAAANATAALTNGDGEDILGPAATLALPTACAIEMIHTYSLVHDDLPAMDNDMLRRGRPTLHVVYGDGIAILAGDALQAEAFALIAREPVTSDAAIATRKLRVVELIGEAAGAIGMVGGQAVDLQAAGQAAGHVMTLDAKGLQAMHLRKTGALIRAAAVAGAVMAGGDRNTVTAIDGWAAEIGLAFQIVDDILDVEGNAQDLGKTTGKDAAGDKPTYPSLYGLARSRQMADECADRARTSLESAHLARGWLGPIGEWVVTRKS
jgi:geranylgeranyl diphosphate synthase type II